MTVTQAKKGEGLKDWEKISDIYIYKNCTYTHTPFQPLSEKPPIWVYLLNKRSDLQIIVLIYR